jgi:AcrR family transcriptional regulator
MTQAETLSTQERILEAAARVFAERGFRGATLREVAARAGTNLASAHYHFGSKEGLYMGVVSGFFQQLEAAHRERGLSPDDATLDRLSAGELRALLRSRVELLLETLLRPPGLHGTLMVRELCDPTDALPEIVRRFIAPFVHAFERILQRLAPGLPPDALARCMQSVAGQVFFYRSHRPALLLLRGIEDYPPGFVAQAAHHITEFSLGGLARLAAAGGD